MLPRLAAVVATAAAARYRRVAQWEGEPVGVVVRRHDPQGVPMVCMQMYDVEWPDGVERSRGAPQAGDARACRLKHE